MEKKKKKMYECMTCHKVFQDDDLPTINNGDGCCSIGSLIEVNQLTVSRHAFGNKPVILITKTK